MHKQVINCLRQTTCVNSEFYLLLPGECITFWWRSSVSCESRSHCITAVRASLRDMGHVVPWSLYKTPVSKSSEKDFAISYLRRLASVNVHPVCKFNDLWPHMLIGLSHECKYGNITSVFSFSESLIPHLWCMCDILKHNEMANYLCWVLVHSCLISGGMPTYKMSITNKN